MPSIANSSHVAGLRHAQGMDQAQRAHNGKPSSGQPFNQRLKHADNRAPITLSKAFTLAVAFSTVVPAARARPHVGNAQRPGPAQSPFHGGGLKHEGQAAMNDMSASARSCLQQHGTAQNQRAAAAFCMASAAERHGATDLNEHRKLRYTLSRAIGVDARRVNAPPAAPADDLRGIKTEIMSKFVDSDAFANALDATNEAFKRIAEIKLYDSDMPSNTAAVLKGALQPRMMENMAATDAALKAFGSEVRKAISIELENMHEIDQRISQEQKSDIQRDLGRRFMNAGDSSSTRAHRASFISLLNRHLRNA